MQNRDYPVVQFVERGHAFSLGFLPKKGEGLEVRIRDGAGVFPLSQTFSNSAVKRARRNGRDPIADIAAFTQQYLRGMPQADFEVLLSGPRARADGEEGLSPTDRAALQETRRVLPPVKFTRDGHDLGITVTLTADDCAQVVLEDPQGVIGVPVVLPREMLDPTSDAGREAVRAWVAQMRENIEALSPERFRELLATRAPIQH